MTNDRLLSGVSLDPSSVVLDIGAFRGEWSKYVATTYGCRPMAFEPVFEFYYELSMLAPAVTPFHFGLAAESGEADISVWHDASSLTPIPDAPLERIRLVGIYEFLEDHGLDQIDLAEINIEGAEYDLLDYMIGTNLIGRFSHLLIQFHRNVEGCDERHAAIADGLRRTHDGTGNPFVWQTWVRR